MGRLCRSSVFVTAGGLSSDSWPARSLRSRVVGALEPLQLAASSSSSHASSRISDTAVSKNNSNLTGLHLHETLTQNADQSERWFSLRLPDRYRNSRVLWLILKSHGSYFCRGLARGRICYLFTSLARSAVCFAWFSIVLFVIIIICIEVN